MDNPSRSVGVNVKFESETDWSHIHVQTLPAVAITSDNLFLKVCPFIWNIFPKNLSNEIYTNILDCLVSIQYT